LLCVLPANAADMPVKAPALVPAVWSWNGFYVGVNGGYGWSRSNLQEAGGFNSGNFQGTGGLVGATFGWNWQAPRSQWVLGIEGDIDWANIKGGIPTVTSNCFTPDCHDNIRWLSTVRGRAGYAIGSLLPFVTAGAAIGSVYGQEGTPPGTGGSGTVTTLGWTAGGGLEAALGGAWSVKGEYLYVDLGRHTYFTQGAPFGATSISVRANILRLGVNYRF